MTIRDVLDGGVEALIALTGLVAAVVLRRRLGGRAAGFAIGAFSVLLVLHLGGYVWRRVFSAAVMSPAPLPGQSAESRLTWALDILQWINWAFALLTVISAALLLAAILTNRHPTPKSKAVDQGDI